MDADGDGDAPAPAPAGRGLPLPISPPRLDSDAPPPDAPGEAASGGVGQDEVPVLPVAQHQVGLHLGGAGRQDGEVLDEARFAGQRPGADHVRERVAVGEDDLHVLPEAEQHAADGADHVGERVAFGEVDLQVLPEAEEHAVDGADHVGEHVAGDHEGGLVGGDGITPDALPPVGRGGNGVGAGNRVLGAGRAALPPRGRGRGGEHPGAALPPRGRGRGGEHRRAPDVVDLHGPGANRPDAKGLVVPRLGKKFQSKDVPTNALNYELQTLYRQLQERKTDAREADDTSGRKAALTIAKQYEKGLIKAEGLRRRIARAGAVPVGLSKDPFA